MISILLKVKFKLLFSTSLWEFKNWIIQYKTIILAVVLYGCEAWSITLRKECRPRIFENRIQRRIFGPKRDENLPLPLQWGMRCKFSNRLVILGPLSIVGPWDKIIIIVLVYLQQISKETGRGAYRRIDVRMVFSRVSIDAKFIIDRRFWKIAMAMKMPKVPVGL